MTTDVNFYNVCSYTFLVIFKSKYNKQIDILMQRRTWQLGIQ